MTNPMKSRWAIMGLWLLASVAGFMMVISVGLLLPSISADLELSPTQQGFYGSAAFLGNLFLALPISWWVSRYKPKILTTVTFVLSSSLMFVQSWSPNFAVLLLGRLGFGISTLAREPARVLLMHRLFTPRDFIVVSSVYNLLFGLVVGGGLVLTPLILSRVGDELARRPAHVRGGARRIGRPLGHSRKRRRGRGSEAGADRKPTRATEGSES